MRCSRCKKDSDRVIRKSFYVRKDGTENVSWYCRECNAQKTARYYKGHKALYNEMVYRSIQKHRNKQTAREQLNKALRHGSVQKPDRCTNCNTKCSPHGHHDDYTKPLEVKWLCRGCHADVHRAMR